MPPSKLAVITGGSSGIGLHVAKEYLRRQYRVVITSNHQERLDAALAALHRLSPHAAAVWCDVGDTASVQRFGDQVLSDHGCPDVLVNAAGFGVYRTFEQSTLEEIVRLADVNFIGALRCSHVFVRQMMERRAGAIVCIASIAGRLILTPNAVYGGAKTGMVAWAEALQYELKRCNVSVHIICPGRVETPFFDHPTFQQRTHRPETRYTVTLDQVALGLVRAVEQRRFLTYIPKTLGLLVWLLNAAPILTKPIYARLMLARIEDLYRQEPAPWPEHEGQAVAP